MRKILEKILYFLAKRIIKKYKPKVIGITGSIGKTSAKEAIFLVIRTKFNTRTNFKNYNNELGVPLTIIGKESGGKSIIKWLKILGTAMHLLLFKKKDYPEYLVLEMGADHPGDIKNLVNLAPCEVGVLTHVAPVHLEFLKSLKGVYNEKKNIVTHLNKNNWAVVNADEDWSEKIKQETGAQFLTYGFSDKADVQLYNFNEGNTLIEGFKGKILYKDNIIPFHFPNLIAPFSLYAILSAVAVGLTQGINVIESINALKSYKLPLGRLQLLKGKNDSVLIDDSYNASPVAVKKSIEMLDNFTNEKYRKILALGDMLELGEDKENYHLDIAKQIAKSDIKIVFTVGQLSRLIHDYLKKNTNKELYHFDHSKYLVKFLDKFIRPNDLFFVKGSQGIRMERVSEAILADNLDPKKHLTRQGEDWL